MFESLGRFLMRFGGYLTIGFILLFSFIYFFNDDIQEWRKGEFNALSEGVHEYEVEGVRFRVQGEYLSPYYRLHPGKVRVLRLESSMPNMMPRSRKMDPGLDVGDSDRIRFDISKRAKEGVMTEFVPVSYQDSLRKITSEGWVSYRNDLGFLYYKDLGSNNASRMRCDYVDRVPNPGCHVTFYLLDGLEVNINFLLSERQKWLEIEDKVRTKLNEFIINGST